MNPDRRLTRIEEQISASQDEHGTEGVYTLPIPGDVAPKVRTETAELADDEHERECFSPEVAAAIRAADRPEGRNR